jgi:hypothetical protein
MIMHPQLSSFLLNGTFVQGPDGIYSVPKPSFVSGQDAERKLREQVAVELYVNYSLHTTPFNRMVYWLLGKTFHKEGMRKNKFHLSRANDRQRQIVVNILIEEVIDRYTECLHHPDLRLTFGGRVGSPIGKFDKLLGELRRLGRWIARQRSFEARKSTMTSVIK